MGLKVWVKGWGRGLRAKGVVGRTTGQGVIVQVLGGEVWEDVGHRERRREEREEE